MVMRPKHKFSATRTTKDNVSFASKLEADYYDKLKLLKKVGKVLFFLRQVPLHLGDGKSKYVVDFVEFWSNGEVRFVDVKGFETAEFKLKKKLVESLYPIEIEIVKK